MMFYYGFQFSKNKGGGEPKQYTPQVHMISINV